MSEQVDEGLDDAMEFPSGPETVPVPETDPELGATQVAASTDEDMVVVEEPDEAYDFDEELPPAPYRARHAMEPLDVVEAAEVDASPWSLRSRAAALFWRWPAAVIRQWPILVVWGGIIIGLVLIYMQHWRRGAVIVGSAVGLAAVFRLVLPPSRAGLLVVRSRLLDVLFAGGAGVAIMGLAMIVPPR